MKKPENYSYYSNRRKNKIPFKDWPKECKEYTIWKKNIKRHPEWENLSDEDYYKALKESKKQRGKKALSKWHEKYSNMSNEEKKELNSKKGNSWKNLTEKEYKEKSAHMKKISQDFWDNLDASKKKRFTKYKKSKRNKKIPRNETFEEYNKRKEEQIRLLRLNNKRYFESMSPEEKKEFYRKMVKKGRDKFSEKFHNDLEFQKEQREFLKKIGKKGNEKTRELWKTDPEFRKKAMAHIRDMNQKTRDLWATNEAFRKNQTEKSIKKFNEFYESLSKDELHQKLKHNKFNEKFEKMFNESSLSDNFYFIREYKVTKDSINKFWDYAIYNKCDNSLQMVVDLDGAYYHGDNSDYNGIHSQEEFDERRSLFIPDNVKVHIIGEYSLLDGFKEMIQKLIVNYDEYIDNIFKSVYMTEFPYPKYSQLELNKSFISLINMNFDSKYLKLSTNTRLGDRIINHFHYSIYSAKCKNCISPYEAWNDPILLKKCIENRVIYRSNLNPNKILQGFNINKIAPKVSVFSAGRARLIIHKYLNEFNQIFDPFSGFSGRLLGTVASNKIYVGQDISLVHVMESWDIINFLKNNGFDIQADVVCKDSLTDKGSYECLFTCPPYKDKEIWDDNLLYNKSCDEWIDICLNNFDCKRYVFVVDETTKYKDYIVDIIPNKSHFGNNSEYVICINK